MPLAFTAHPHLLLKCLTITAYPLIYDNVSRVYCTLLLCLQAIRVSDRDSRTVIGRTRHVIRPIWSRIDWLTGPKIHIIGLSFAEIEMDKAVHFEFYLPLSGRSKYQFQ